MCLDGLLTANKVAREFEFTPQSVSFRDRSENRPKFARVRAMRPLHSSRRSAEVGFLFSPRVLSSLVPIPSPSLKRTHYSEATGHLGFRDSGASYCTARNMKRN